MYRSALAQVLSRLLPRGLRDDLFTPSACDLVISRLEAEAGHPGAARRLGIRIGFAASLVLVFLRCWQFAPREAAAWWRDRHRSAPLHPRERATMILYTIRHALRLLVRERAFTATAVLTLALGIGANVAIFAVVEAVMLRPLPYESGDDLIVLKHRDERTGVTKEFIAIGDYVDLHARQDAFEAIGPYGGSSVSVTPPVGDPVRASALTASPGLLEALRVKPAVGRLLDETDSRRGAPPVVVLGDGLWERLFSRSRDAIGRTLLVGTTKRQVVGVAPAGFRFPAGAATDLIVPIVLPAAAPANRKSGWVFALGRLKPGVTIDQADIRLATLSKEMEKAHPQSNAGSLYYVTSLRDQLLGDTKRPLVLLLGAVAVVLMIACANVGNLLLARGLGRRHEMSVRAALGAGQARLVGQLVVESLVLALVAGGAGLLIAFWGVPALVALVPTRVSVPGLDQVGINGRVLAYSFCICVAAAIAFAGLSAVTLRRQNAAEALVSQTRVAGSQTVRRTTSSLVVTEVALSLILLVGAGLILRTFSALITVDPGFAIDGVALIDVQLPAQRYQPVAARQAFYERAFAALSQLHGVEAVGAAVVTPLTGNNWTVPFERADRPVASGTRPPDVGWQSASGGYFRSLRIPLLEGRLFDGRDAAGGPPVVIISGAVAKQFFEGESAIGRKVRIGNGDAEIVGVVGDIRRAGLAEPPRADMYFPFERAPSAGITLFVRAADPSAALSGSQTVLRSLEPGVVFGELTTMSRVSEESIASTRLTLWLLGIFAAVALALAAVGIYGVMSYVVGQRTREFGTRVALGATRADILRLVLRQGGTLTLIGLAAGAAVAILLARSLGSLLYGVSPFDPMTLAASLAALLIAAAAACYLPARRATRIDAARTLAAQ